MTSYAIFSIGQRTICHQYQLKSHLLMGNEQSGQKAAESIDIPNSGDKEKPQMSTVVPHEGGSSQNELQRSNHQPDGNMNQSGNLPLEEKSQDTQSSRPILNAIPKKMEVKYEKMQVVRPAQKKKRINQFEIQVPFNVIILTLNPELMKTINEMGHDIFEKYYNVSGTSGWKLHKNGYYINYLAKKLTAILTETVYFQGELEQDANNRIYPKSSGILLNANGRFEGKFQYGKANGDGTFEDRTKNAFFKGVFKDGKMIWGTIDSRQYKYKGAFQENIAQGQGVITFKQIEVSYKGQFKKGKYYAKSALYQTKQYLYEGCFINGKKNQQGKLVEKQRDYKNNQVKYKPPCQFQGFWSQDIYFSSQALATMKKNQEKDPTNSNMQEQNLVVPVIQQVIFEQEQNKTIAADDQRVQMPVVIEDQFQNLKPRFIWVEPPQQPKKKKKKKNQDDEEVF